jgi:hypothetical protein
MVAILDKKETNKQAQDILKNFTPDEKAFAEAFATMKIENKMLTRQLVTLKEAYEEIWQLAVVVLDIVQKDDPEGLRLHVSQLKRFKEEYRIDRKVDGEDVVFKLLTVGD